MANRKIKFVRAYKLMNKWDYIDAVCNSGRIITYESDRLPDTVKEWILNHDGYKQYDSVFKRTETIYM